MKKAMPDYLKEVSHYNIREAKPSASKCALLVIDMQQYFQSIASPIMDNIVSVIECCRSKDMKIIFTRHGHKDLLKDGGMLDKWWGDLIHYGSEEWELIKSLQPEDNDTILDKNRKGVSIKMGRTKHSILFLAVFLLLSCADKTPQRDNAYNNDNWYAKEVMKYASEWLAQLESDIPTEPVCRLGIVFESNLIVSAVSPSARKAGFLVGDCLSAIDGEYLLSEEDVLQNINRKRAGELVIVSVVRGHDTVEIKARCKNARKLQLLDMELVKAAANGEWDKCILLSYKTEKENGKISEYSYTRLCCSEAKRLISKREPTEKDAKLHFEHFSRVISESSYDPEALHAIRNDLQNGISWLEHHGFHTLAEDLIAQWETAVNSEVPNCLPCEDKRMIFFVPPYVSIE